MPTPYLEAILGDLPDMPEDVAAQWLAPHAERPGFGWPPPEDGRVDPWGRLLAGRPLAWWKGRQWRKEALPITFEYMSNVTRFQVTQLLNAGEKGIDLMPESRRRIEVIRAHIANTGTWPRAPVAYPDSDGLALIDGHHRLAALQSERARRRHPIHDRHSIWIALPRQSSVS